MKEEQESKGSNPEYEDEDVEMYNDDTDKGSSDEDVEADKDEDKQKMLLRFKVDDRLATQSSTGAKLLRCYWDQGALLASEWNVPLLGRYQNKAIELWLDEEDRCGVVPMDWDSFNVCAPKLQSTKAFWVSKSRQSGRRRM